MNHPVHRSLKAAYSFYNVHTTTSLIDLMGDALILAKSVSGMCVCESERDMFIKGKILLHSISTVRMDIIGLHIACSLFFTVFTERV